jgi:hypothetical protein
MLYVKSKTEKLTINRVQRLIQHGAKYIIVADIFPVGCLPMVLTLLASRDKADYDQHGCLRSVNRLVPQYQNSLLRQRIKVLRNKYPHTTIISAEYYGPLIAFLHKPGHFGELVLSLMFFYKGNSATAL